MKLKLSNKNPTGVKKQQIYHIYQYWYCSHFNKKAAIYLIAFIYEISL